MGSIMAIGVAVANAILLVTFAEGHRRQENADATHAAVEGARSRLRPILMTSCAMIAGMVPMSLGLTEGGEQTAPLARAVIGGLVAATIATLTVLPTVFALVQGKTGRESASLDPDDPASPHYHEAEDESRTSAEEPTARQTAQAAGNGEPQVIVPQARPAGPELPERVSEPSR
jgi:predicted RND superfamily exporter protein